jgi:hypothetical protein
MQPDALDLSGLRDIHTPEALSAFWPPAPGWWLLLLLILLTPVALYLVHFYRLRSAKLYALKQLEVLEQTAESDAGRYAEEVSKLLRRIALLRFGKDEVASLAEREWVDFLIKTGDLHLDKKLSDLFAYAPYAKGQFFDPESLANLKKAALAWINKNA